MDWTLSVARPKHRTKAGWKLRSAQLLHARPAFDVKQSVCDINSTVYFLQPNSISFKNRF
jgi:hypothetical protein